MQVDAIFENGIIKLQTPLRLKEKRVKVQVVIPDEFFDHKLDEQSAMRKEIHAILGSYGHSGLPAAPDQDKAAWHEHLARKYGK